MRWVEALKIWNDSKDTWCIPKKGTKGYDEVIAIMNGKKEPCPPCPKPRKAASRSPSPEPKKAPKKKRAPRKKVEEEMEEVDDVEFTMPPKKAKAALGKYSLGAPCPPKMFVA
jgi:hypothetical protein